MIETILTVLQVIVCLVLILSVLFQSGKNAGLGDIGGAAETFFGKNKAKAVKGMVEGGVSQFCPASALQMHPDAVVFLDEDAASELELKDYYKWSSENEPAL